MNNTSQIRPLYKLEPINSKYLSISKKYQRRKHDAQINAIIADFSEYIANEPKVSYRNGIYNIFDGQHTALARKKMNGGKDLDILCKVYYDLTLEEEAALFAKQFGESHKITGGEELKALLVANNKKAWAFKRATEKCGAYIEFGNGRGNSHISCVKTAFKAYQKIGEDRYMEMLSIIVGAWNGAEDSFMSQSIQAFSEFVSVYHGKYDYNHLITCLRSIPPRFIVNAVKTDIQNHGKKKFIYPIFNLYNDSGDVEELPLKF